MKSNFIVSYLFTVLFYDRANDYKFNKEKEIRIKMAFFFRIGWLCTHRFLRSLISSLYSSLAMLMNHNGEYDSPMAPDLFQQQTPVLTRKQSDLRTTNKRPRSNISPPGQQQQQQTDIPRNLNQHNF